MNANSFLTADYLDILFENRNKQYGGYELRRNYGMRARRAMYSILILLFIPVLLMVVFKKKDITTALLTPKPTILADLQLYTPPPAKPIEIPKMQPIASSTIAATPPVIVRDNTDIKNEMPPVDVLANNTPGTGNNSNTITGDGDSRTEPPGTIEPTIAEPPAAPVRYVEQMPEFEGNFHNYLNYELRYPALARENDIEGKVLVEFVVNEDGAISAARIVRGIGGGCDEEALRVIKNMPKWKPGRQNGRAVKVFFTLPIIFNLE